MALLTKSELQQDTRSQMAHPVPALVLTGLFFFCFAAIISPDRLSMIGLMDHSLASDIPLVRQTALWEIDMARKGAVGIGSILLICALFWPRLVASNQYQRFTTWRLSTTIAYERQLDTVWNLSLYIMLICFALSWVYLSFGEEWFSAQILGWINREDGLLETLSAVLLMLASILSLVTAIRVKGMPARSRMHLFLALLFFAMCGEEISWGQRYIGFETPDSLKTVNVQSEVNLHNMFGYVFDHLFILCFFLWGCVTPLLYRRTLMFRQFFRAIGLPIPSLGLAISMLLITLTREQIVYLFVDGIDSLRLPELREFLSCVAFLLLMRESYLGLVVLPKRLPENDLSARS